MLTIHNANLQKVYFTVHLNEPIHSQKKGLKEVNELVDSEVKIP